jgi:hypothetical protein
MSVAEVYTKSIAAGIVALFVSAILWIFAMWTVVHIISSRQSGTHFVIYHFGPALRSPVIWTIAATIFVCAFFLEFRELSRQSTHSNDANRPQ